MMQPFSLPGCVWQFGAAAKHSAVHTAAPAMSVNTLLTPPRANRRSSSISARPDMELPPMPIMWMRLPA